MGTSNRRAGTRAVGTRETYRNVLVQACIVAGDETALANRLEVPVGAVVDWLSGDAPVPTQVFLRAVDVVMVANHRKQVEDNRAVQIRQRYRR
jgi:hypothetical protein